MYVLDIVKISIASIFANRIRAGLTVLGIVIGISSVIAMVSVGQGAQQQILQQLQGFGPNAILIVPVGNFSGPRGQSDFAALLNNRLDRNVLKIIENDVIFREVSAISPQISQTFEISVRSRMENYTVYGVRDEFVDVYGLELREGRFINQNDDSKLNRVVVLGPEVADELFGENQAVGKSIQIQGSNYLVVGVAEAQSEGLDDRVYVPLSTAAYVLIGDRNYSQIAVRVDDESLVDSVAIKLEQELLEYFREPDMDSASFSIVTSKEILSLVGTVTGVFTTLLASIASISLVVGGIGIMNIMLVTVSERTREIGLRKAVGATQKAILGQFLLEATILTLFGGIIGIVMGIGFALMVSRFGGIPALFTIESIILASSVSALIGILFGFYPAYTAARLNPIDSLRYE